jgi:malic enzyme
VSKQSLQIAKRKLSNFGENSVISILIMISQVLNALPTTFYTPNVAHANFSVETISANHKSQTFKFRRKLCYFIPDRDIQAFKRSFHSILHAERSARQFQRRNNPCKSQNSYVQNFGENSVISFLVQISRRLNALSTPFYTPNVAHAKFRVQTIPANRKTQTYKFRRKLGYFVPD